MSKRIYQFGKAGIKVISILDPIRKPFLTGLVVLGIIFFVANFLTAPIRLSTQTNKKADTLEQTAKTHIQNKQYSQAEQVYNNIIRKYPKTDYGFKAYKELISLYIKTGDLRTAQDSFNIFVTQFKGHENLSLEIYTVAKHFADAGYYDNALEVFSYNLANFNDEYAMWSQSEIVYSDILKRDDAAAESAIVQLLTNYSEQENIAKAVCQIADQYCQLQRHQQADKLYQKVVESWPGGEYAMWSQMHLALSNIRNGNYAAADIEVVQLLAGYPDNEFIALAIWQVAKGYEESKKYAKALEINQYNVEHFPHDKYAMWSHTEITFEQIKTGDLESAQKSFDTLITRFKDQESLSWEICNLANHFADVGYSDKSLEIHNYNLAHFNDKPAMWSQVEITFEQIKTGDLESAQKSFDTLITRFKDQESLSWEICNIAEYYAGVGMNDKASELYQKSLELYQSSAQTNPESQNAIWTKTGIIRAKNGLGAIGDVKTVVDELKAEFSDHPDLPFAVLDIGFSYYRKARLKNLEGDIKGGKELYKKAIGVWERIIQKFHNLEVIPNAYYSSAICYAQELNDYKQGIDYFQTIVEKWPNYEYAWNAQYLVGKYYETLFNSGAISESEALTNIEKAYEAVVEKYPNCEMVENALLRLGQINSDNGKFPEAIVYFEMLLEKEPKKICLISADLIKAYEEMANTEKGSVINSKVEKNCPQ